MPRISEKTEIKEHDDMICNARGKFLSDLRISVQNRNSEILPKLKKGCKFSQYYNKDLPPVVRGIVQKIEYDRIFKCHIIYYGGCNHIGVDDETFLISEEDADWIEKIYEINRELFEVWTQSDGHLRSVISRLLG